ncbi:MAG: MFS transporter [Aliidongia sp.]
MAAAIMTPPTGFLAGRFGLKRLYLVSIVGFTIASMLCGMAQSLVQIVLFRVLQGLFGAAPVAAVADRPAQHKPARAARLGHGALGHGRDGRSDPRAGAGRLADLYL